jgi:hypothetical protein
VADVRRGRVRAELAPVRVGYGVRLYLRCPRCSRRAVQLYHLAGATACRVCLALRYPSQSLYPAKRLRYRADRIVLRLGGRDGAGLVPKPPTMHWNTYHRLMDEAQRCNDDALLRRLRVPMCRAS